MSNSSLAFAFDDPSPPVVVMAAQTMASELAGGRALSRSDVTCRFPLRIDPVFPSRIDPGDGMSRRAGFGSSW
ncbi:DUF3819 domain-containing protein, partial [Novosphingobium sp. B1]|uniref:DUF3819 domain-containing protein n=1 Tax=Novosphingobium sp. B1 TaxID=1938756 RepID=UPI0009D89FB5